MTEAKRISWNRYVIDDTVMKECCNYDIDKALRECEYIHIVWEPEDRQWGRRGDDCCWERDIEKRYGTGNADPKTLLFNVKSGEYKLLRPWSYNGHFVDK